MTVPVSDYMAGLIGELALHLFDRAAEEGGFVLLCQGCGEPFPYFGKWGRGIPAYCSRQCKRDGHNDRRRWARARRRAERPCLGCDETFTPTRNDAKYCSTQCRQRAYRQRQGATDKSTRSHTAIRRAVAMKAP